MILISLLIFLFCSLHFALLFQIEHTHLADRENFAFSLRNIFAPCTHTHTYWLTDCLTGLTERVRVGTERVYSTANSLNGFFFFLFWRNYRFTLFYADDDDDNDDDEMPFISDARCIRTQIMIVGINAIALCPLSILRISTKQYNGPRRNSVEKKTEEKSHTRIEHVINHKYHHFMDK